jgi:geranylgeranyl diphosphate synthase type II
MPQAKRKRVELSQSAQQRTGSRFSRRLASYRKRTMRELLKFVPADGPAYLYDLICEYPLRSGKGLRAALCSATCGALGGRDKQSLNSAVAIELFHNAFLIHDDIQDASELRRGGPTLYRSYGLGIGVNVGNATNLVALQRLMANRRILGPQISWLVMAETEVMLRHSLEGQAIELGWIRDNICRLTLRDYLRMCLKKTSWYSFIYPLRVGAIIAEGNSLAPDRFTRLGWYLGAAFQIHDDILNLTGNAQTYGKEILGDLWEGKRSLMLIHLLRSCSRREFGQIKSLLAKERAARSDHEVQWLYELMLKYKCIEYARGVSKQFAGAAFMEALSSFRTVPDSPHKRFILELILYVVRRNR